MSEGEPDRLMISVPSTRVYAMKRGFVASCGGWATYFSTLDSGLRDETHPGGERGWGGDSAFQYPRLGSTR